MARPDSFLGKLIGRQTIGGTSIRDKDISGDNDPRLRPIDLPLPDGGLQNESTIGMLHERFGKRWQDLSPAQRTLAAQRVFNQEYYLRKGVDVDSDSLYPDSETKESLRRKNRAGGLANPRYFKQLEEEMEERLNLPHGTGGVTKRNKGKA